MLIKQNVNGLGYNNIINDAIDKDVRFKELPENMLLNIGDISEKDGEVEVYKYNDGMPDF